MTTPTQLAAATSRRVTSCRLCGSGALEPYLDLGHHPPSDQFRRADQLADPSVHFPLVVVLCLECGLSQLSCVVAPEILYQDEYPYESSTTRAGQTHFHAFAESVASRFTLGPDDLVVDVGSNIGVLLAGFAEQGTRVLGVDPAANIAELANQRGISTLAEFFSRDVARQIAAEHGHASVITATNVFAHVDDLVEFMSAVDELLAPDGIFVFEAPHFANLVALLEYDTVYHEHLSYISIKPLIPFFARFGMRIFDVQEVDLHGGSCRVFIDRGGNAVDDQALDHLLARERMEGSHDLGRLRRFADDVASHRQALTRLVHELRRDGHRIAAVSAPAKGMTLLNYCRFGSETIEYVTEKSGLKIGRFTPGTHIPVVPDAHLIENRPDFALLLAWNFADEIIGNLTGYAEIGGRFIVPIPSPTVAVGPGRPV